MDVFKASIMYLLEVTDQLAHIITEFFLALSGIGGFLEASKQTLQLPDVLLFTLRWCAHHMRLLLHFAVHLVGLFNHECYPCNARVPRLLPLVQVHGTVRIPMFGWHATALKTCNVCCRIHLGSWDSGKPCQLLMHRAL